MPGFFRRSSAPVEEDIVYTAPSTSLHAVADFPSLTHGYCPSGTMHVTKKRDATIPGSPRTKVIQISYDIPPGQQKPYHPNGGLRYSNDVNPRIAYLPNDDDGRRLLKRLKAAWKCGFTFKVGRSQTSGNDNVVTWDAVPHKTQLAPGSYGYPDPNYIGDCHAALDNLGIPSDPDKPPPSLIPATIGIVASPTATSALPVAQAIAVPSPIPTPSSLQASLPRPTAFPETIEYMAPPFLSASASISEAFEVPLTPVPGDCTICQDSLMGGDPVLLLAGCHHAFHQDCIDECFNKTDLRCPTCKTPVGEPQGKCPSGTMRISKGPQQCPGYMGAKTIVISYELPSGTQLPYHPKPGMRYGGDDRTAYLPDNEDGLRVLARLRYAWTHGLTFMVGRSVTRGVDDVVVWTSIHHKTSIHGGSHGFPDPTYISNVNDSLDALHVPRTSF